jgi:hypothetical protein
MNYLKHLLAWALALLYLFGLYTAFFKGFWWFLFSLFIPPIPVVLGLIQIFGS